MIDTRRRSALARAVALGVAALLGIGIGFWIGRANPGSTAHPDVLQGTVTRVGGARPGDQFTVELADPPFTDQKTYDVGAAPWSASNAALGGGTPPCLVVGHHITFEVVHVRHGLMSKDETVWIDCGSDTFG